jgi:hypothetical protein
MQYAKVDSSRLNADAKGLRILAMICFTAENAKEPKNQSIRWFCQKCGIPLQPRMCDTKYCTWKQY